MNKYFDDFQTEIHPEELDIEGVYDYILNQEDNEYEQRTHNFLDRFSY